MQNNKIIGILDASKTVLNLGGILIFIQHLLIQSKIHRVDLCDVGYIGEKHPLLSLFHEFEGIGNIFYYKKRDELEDIKSLEVSTDNTRLIQSFYKNYGFIPYLSIKKKHEDWINNIFKNKCNGKIPVVVHLKNNPKCSHCSNADQDVWYRFFQMLEKNSSVLFILIGEDVIDTRILALSNVVQFRDLGSNLIRDLALIQQASLFMGMASGPCNMAIFSKTPYIIFKDPDHHMLEMQKELGDKNQYNFAKENQFIFRSLQTVAKISSAFHNWYNRVILSDPDQVGRVEGSLKVVGQSKCITTSDRSLHSSDNHRSRSG